MKAQKSPRRPASPEIAQLEKVLRREARIDKERFSKQLRASRVLARNLGPLRAAIGSPADGQEQLQQYLRAPRAKRTRRPAIKPFVIADPVLLKTPPYDSDSTGVVVNTGPAGIKYLDAYAKSGDMSLLIASNAKATTYCSVYASLSISIDSPGKRGIAKVSAAPIVDAQWMAFSKLASASTRGDIRLVVSSMGAGVVEDKKSVFDDHSFWYGDSGSTYLSPYSLSATLPIDGQHTINAAIIITATISSYGRDRFDDVGLAFAQMTAFVDWVVVELTI